MLVWRSEASDIRRKDWDAYCAVLEAAAVRVVSSASRDQVVMTGEVDWSSGRI